MPRTITLGLTYSNIPKSSYKQRHLILTLTQKYTLITLVTPYFVRVTSSGDVLGSPLMYQMYDVRCKMYYRRHSSQNGREQQGESFPSPSQVRYVMSYLRSSALCQSRFRTDSRAPAVLLFGCERSIPVSVRLQHTTYGVVRVGFLKFG